MGSNDNAIDFISAVQPLAGHVVSFQNANDWIGALCLIPGTQMFTLNIDAVVGGAVAPDLIDIDVCLTVVTLSRSRDAFP